MIKKFDDSPINLGGGGGAYFLHVFLNNGKLIKKNTPTSFTQEIRLYPFVKKINCTAKKSYHRLFLRGKRGLQKNPKF